MSVTDKGTVSGYERWTNYETAETGVRYTDEFGEWIRTSFTSREDNVSITKIEQSSAGAKINMIISIDDISSMYKARDGDVRAFGTPIQKACGSECGIYRTGCPLPVLPGTAN